MKKGKLKAISHPIKWPRIPSKWSPSLCWGHFLHALHPIEPASATPLLTVPIYASSVYNTLLFYRLKCKRNSFMQKVYSSLIQT